MVYTDSTVWCRLINVLHIIFLHLKLVALHCGNVWPTLQNRN